MELQSSVGSAAAWEPGCACLAEFAVASEPGGERGAVEKVTTACAGLGLGDRQLSRVRTAVAEAVMNAIEHGNCFSDDLPVHVRVSADGCRLRVAVIDHGEGRGLRAVELPDLEAKLDGRQTTRGWGLYLMGRMADALETVASEGCNTVVLTFNLCQTAEGKETYSGG